MNLPRLGDTRPPAADTPRPEARAADRGEVRRDSAAAGGEQRTPARPDRGTLDRSLPDLAPMAGRHDAERGRTPADGTAPLEALPRDDGLAATSAALRPTGRPPLPLPDPELSERFHKALRGDDDHADALPSPMSLFSALPPPAPVTAVDPPPPPPALWQQIDRLLVADGSESRDSRRQARMTLADRELRGTEVEVGEAGGELRVAFLCADIATRRRLALHAPTMAAQLAERLDRAVQVVVGSTDRHDPERTECRQGAPA